MGKFKVYLLAEDVNKGYTAGEKARKDIVEILSKERDVEYIKFFDKGSNKIIVIIQIIASIIKLGFKIKKDEYTVIQYPYSPKFMYVFIYKLIGIISKLKKSKMIAIIHDINYLRNISEINDEFSKYNKKLECDTLNRFDKIVCHNEIMKSVLIRDGVREDKLVTLKIFDYLSENTKTKKKFDDKNIVISIAGKLDKNKSGYLYRLKDIISENISFELYGIGYIENEKDSNVKYKGVAAPEDLPKLLSGNFGLVWDGQSLEKCDGVAGEYLKYNNPHKVSSYIACGLPVIVWEKSAVSRFVRENNIGLCVNNLNEINSVIKELNKDKYDELVQNVNLVKAKLIQGQYLIDAINKCICSK